MEIQKTVVQKQKKSLFLFFFTMGIVLVAFNLRPAITSVGPLVGVIQADLGLAHWSAGLLMSVPLITFAIMSPIVPKIANRLTNEKTLLVGLCVLLIGVCIRSVSMSVFLFFGTVFIGMGISIGNVLLPVVIKDKFPQKFGLMTSVYSTSMGLVASLASGLSVPLASGLNLGWQGALIVWGIPAVLAILIWVYLIRLDQGKGIPIKSVSLSATKIWRSPLAWQIALFMGFQSFLFYVTITWLPEILISHGISRGTAGWLLSFTQIIGLPSSFFIPVLAARLTSQVWVAFGLGLCSVVGYAGLWFGSSFPILIISITLIGIALGGNFPLALSYIGIRARNARRAAELSGMAQSTGYLLAAVGPIFIGYLFDVAQDWTIPLFALILISALVMIFGMSSGRARHVE
ncbi:CynX/NimT family MFS transporter [Peribacillus sp. NPDC097264]|uniref:CynX/NimT family MFS transporter n=1 Tax=Peribacillus sp. NPDC097264 TaxID=3390616 RepID=UPI003D0928AB